MVYVSEQEIKAIKIIAESRTAKQIRQLILERIQFYKGFLKIEKKKQDIGELNSILNELGVLEQKVFEIEQKLKEFLKTRRTPNE